MNRYSTLASWTFALSMSAIFAAPVCAAQYEVGPGRAFATPSEVPWESLVPGDTVLIYWRSTPYKDKWVICRQGTVDQPITVRGVPGPGGELPIIDGSGAVTRLALNYWNESRGVIKIGGSSIPADTMPRYIVLENLDIRSGHAGYGYVDDDGGAGSYDGNAAAIYIEKGENIVIRHSRLHDSGNGLFIASPDFSPSRNIVIEGNDIYDNGNVGSAFEHNTYTEALGITYQFNHFGPLKAGASGNNLKDRSAGLVVRYNWIEGGNRQLDLVESHNAAIAADARYRQTLAYGNVLIERDGEGNRQILMYGGDSGDTPFYRKGTLYFYNNTIVSYRSDRTTLFGIPTNEERVDARNNIFYVTAAGSTLSVVDSAGVVDLAQNWFKPGYVTTFSVLAGGVTGTTTSLLGSAPGFLNEAGQDFRLAAGSSCKDAGAGLSSSLMAANAPVYQYVKHLGSEARPADAAIDVGAYEAGSTAPAPAPSQPATFTLPTNGATNVDTSQPLQWTTSAGAQAYYLYIGTALGLKDLVDTGEIQATSYTAKFLPPGRTVFARIHTLQNAIWRSNDITFTVAAPKPAVLTFPANGAQNISLATPFQWTSAAGAQAYYLYVGTTPGAKNLVDTGEIQGTAYASPALPAGQTLYARIWTKMGGGWLASPDVSFSAASATIATLINPPNGSQTFNPSEPFAWTSAASVQAYYLYVGTTVGAKNLVDTGEILSLSYAPRPGLPIDQPLYARIWTKMSGIWRSSDSVFRVSGTGLTFPANGARVTGPSVAFQWIPVSGADVYYLYVGTTPGAKNLVDTGELRSTSYSAPSLPRGVTLYATMWTKANGVWRYFSSTFTVQ